MADAQPQLDSPLSVVEALARHFQAGDFAAAFALYDPNIRIEQPASLPHGGVYQGHAGVRAMGQSFARFWDRVITDPRRASWGDHGVVQVTTQTWTGKATGRAATVDVVELITVSSGKVSEIRVFQQDTQRLLETLAARGAQTQAKLWERSAGLHVVDAAVVAALGRHWEDGWNRADVAMIVAPFHPEVVFSSPFAARFGDDPSTATIRGLEAVRKYVADSFERATHGITYTLDAAYAGTDAVVLTYTVHHPKAGDRSGVDTMLLGPDGKVIEWRCHYAFAS
jgi:ketosteroid isomerase-like protein